MKKFNFCPYCGQYISLNYAHCLRCGFNIQKYKNRTKLALLSKNNQNILKSKREIKFNQSNLRRYHKESIQKKKQHQFLIIFSLITFFIIGVSTVYFIGTFYFSRSRQIKKLAEQVTSTNPQTLSKIIINEKNQPLKYSEILPLTKLYQSSKHEQELMHEKIISVPTSGNIQIIKNGKILGLYPKYKILLKKNCFTLKTNLKKPIFAIDNDILNNTGNLRTIQLYPGKYKIECIGISNHNQKRLKQDLFLSPFEQKQTINFHIKNRNDHKKRLVDPLLDIIKQNDF